MRIAKEQPALTLCFDGIPLLQKCAERCDAGAWAARVKTGYEALLTSALKGKGAMAAQAGGEYEDIEIGRAVVHMANSVGAKFAEPKAPAAAEAPAAAPAAAPAMPAAAPASK